MNASFLNKTGPRRLAVLATVTALLAGTGLGLRSQRKPANERAPERRPVAGTRQSEPPDAGDLPDGLPREQILAVFDPTFVPAKGAKIAPGAFVVGYAHGGEAHAYARNLLNPHEIVNDIVGGQRVAITL